MLTRAGVAKRLGKRIATVRRLEGKVLFPRKDARGIHRFDEAQVDRLRERVKAGARIPAAQGTWLHLPEHYKRRAKELTAGRTQRRDSRAVTAARLVGVLTDPELEGFEVAALDYLSSLLLDA